MKIRVGSRESLLAVVQSEEVMAGIGALYPAIELELVTMKTTGDIIQDRTLDKIGGKGLFVKELDQALLDDRVDLTVHSCKDLPMEEIEAIPLVAFTKRADPRDVLILPFGIAEIDFSKPIGSSSLRRKIQLQKMWPHAIVEPIRGNLQTRLAKLDRGEYSALILAAAGILRLGLEERIERFFTVDEILPAGGQGILVIQGRAEDDFFYLKDLNDNDATVCAIAERAFVREMDGGCSSPIAAYATIQGDRITITGMNAYGVKLQSEGFVKDGKSLAIELANSLKGVKK